MDKTAEDNWAGLFGDREAQLWAANMSGSFYVHCDWYLERHNSGIRLSAELEDHHWNRHKRFVNCDLVIRTLLTIWQLLNADPSLL